MVGMIERREVDIAMPEISFTSDRGLVADFPFAINVEHQRVVVRNTYVRPSLEFGTYASPYSRGFWILAGIVTFVVIVSVHIFMFHEPKGNEPLEFEKSGDSVNTSSFQT